MKISESRLKQIIKEEIEANDTLIRAIENLTDRIEDLDVSVDFLSAAFIGGDPLSIGAAQKSLGRAYRPQIRKPEPQINESDETENSSCAEVSDMIQRRHNELDSQSLSEEEAKELRNQIDVLKQLMVLRGCVG